MVVVEGNGDLIGVSSVTHLPLPVSQFNHEAALFRGIIL